MGGGGVFGPLLDHATAKKRNVTMVQVLSEGNALVAKQLSWAAKLTFWLTNIPYCEQPAL